MDIKAYIESGIIESYVLRLTSPEETAEVESMMSAHPEIAEAVNAFELQLEENLLNNAIAPAPEVKQNIFAAINDVPSFTRSGSGDSPVVSIGRPSKFWRYMAAASILLLVGSTALNIYYYNRYSETAEKYDVLLSERTIMLAKQDAERAKYNLMDSNMQIMKDSSMHIVAMTGRNSKATVYWNTISKDVYVLQNAMPKAPSGKQYQLWAIVDGKPVDAGMLGDCGQSLCKMLNIPRAEAFAITLEKEGGSPTPDMTELYVIGKI